MSGYVIDASVAIKWVIKEPGSTGSLAIAKQGNLIAPDLILPECANVLWKKVQRKELSAAEARFAGRLIEASDLRLHDMRPLFAACIDIAIDLDHPAYDCVYLALAVREKMPFVTADDRLVRKLRQDPHLRYKDIVLPLSDFA